MSPDAPLEKRRAAYQAERSRRGLLGALGHRGGQSQWAFDCARYGEDVVGRQWGDGSIGRVVGLAFIAVLLIATIVGTAWSIFGPWGAAVAALWVAPVLWGVWKGERQEWD